MTYETQPNKSGRIEQEKPALVLLRDGNVIDAAHQFTNTDGQLCVYLEPRDNGIDAKINLDDIIAVIKSEDAARALSLDAAFDTESVVGGGA